MTHLKLRLASGLASIFLATFSMADAAFATTCTPDDWIPGLCDLPIAPAPRCEVATANWIARGACVAATVGCAEIGGCFGNTPVGHWYPYNDLDGITKRCQCGCFGEETEFATASGSITGTDIIARYSTGGARLLSLDSISSRTHSERDINGVIFGPEKELVFEVTTVSGRKVTISSQHPVLIVDESREVLAVKAASKMAVGEFVLAEDGVADRVVSIQQKPYTQRMFNFNVASTNAQNHFIPANGIVLGDNAWQQRLASVDARILLRADLVKELSKSEGNQK